MEAARQLDNVTWADFGIVDDELTVCDHNVDFSTFCFQTDLLKAFLNLGM